MKTLAERRRSAPSLILDKALQKQPSTRESPSASVDTCAFLSSFVCSSRTLLIDGRVELKRGLQRQERHLFLFNDLLLIVKIKYNNNFKVKNKIKLTDMWTASCVDEVGEVNTNATKSFVLGWPTVNFVATFSSPEQKDKWLSLLQRYINLEKEKDYPKSIPLKIFAKDIGNCAYSKTITVTNSDTANEVINMSLRMLGINGSERDYQLWVNSGKEAAPYPLIGHEYPYGIKMNHLRDTAFLTQGSKDSATLSNLQEPFLMEQLPREMQCQFILKPSHLAATQHLNDSGQKTVRRRRSIINWAFWRGSSTHLDNLPVSPTSPIPGQLFGVSLQDICENDNLPKSVLDMLFFLNQKGPLTRGIFRQSANVKSCRELKEKLNSGVEVHLDCESVFVIASVLKDFLRNIPGSIFLSDIYDQWVCVMDQGNDEEKINTVQRLLDQLPRANIILLRYLFGILYNIEKNSSTNQMNAFNLAVCVTPSLIWPPTSSSPELEHEFTKKVSLLIQFLIENCCRIFGHEITSLFGEVSLRIDTKENSSDTSCVQLNDSSYDSLENELNEDIDAPCSDLVKKLGQGSRSMDSVLTLSDYDIDHPEVEGLLTLSDFDLDHSTDQDIQMKRPPGCKPVNVSVRNRKASLGEQAGASSNTCTPIYLSTAAADAPKSLRRLRRCSEPSIDYRDSKVSYLREFHQKKLRKSSCDAILSQKDEDDLKQKTALPEEGTICLEQSLVTGTDISRKNTTSKNIKKKSSSGNEGNYVKVFTNSKPVAISVASSSHMSPQDHSGNQHSDANTSGYSPPHIADTFKSSRTHRRCSEPNIDVQNCKLTYLRGIYSKKQHKISCEASLLQGEEDYLIRHKSLQMEGQKLINQSLVMGIEVGKSSATNQSTEKVLPPRLNLCPSTSSSSLSSPGTSPSGSSVSSQDSAFSQISEHSVFTPTETSSPIDCTFQAQKKQENLSSDISASSLYSKMPGSSEGQASSHLAYTKKDTMEWHLQMHSGTLHPSTWLKNSVASLKNWSLKKKAKVARPEEKKNSLKGHVESVPYASDVPEANSLQEIQKDLPLRAAEGLGAMQTVQLCSSASCLDSEKHYSSPFSLVESRFKLSVKSYKGGETEGQCCSGPLPWEKASSSSGTINNVAIPDVGPTVVSDGEDKPLTKDI
ncbi:rho GTPase-activating protein 20 [Fukomys damarensis]|uniref:rho GTPase-activating protein 20 n=1 Tax=Fukomys damarensis TaxID=885580 RepID=UPI00053FBF9F|nr:rho GTPase-activating protein 20 [Fukomys damarensis]XP_010608956.1 rho GTPase-activating protein 20 [Fukomys damarensis]XP_010608957.1 rho GTPase-activating protein 20 [Fukomys damarensis]